MKKLFVLTVQAFLVLFLFAIGNAAQITGHIYDETTGKAIPDANIMILNTAFGAASRDGGFYFIGNVPPGQYEVAVSVIGYKPGNQLVLLNQDEIRLNFSLAPQPIELDPIIVTATLSEHRQSQVTVASEVLSLARLPEKTGHTVGEVLQSNTSVYFNSYDGITGPQIASIRGSNVDQVLVLLDGLRLNTAQGGGIDLNLLPVAALERIEIVRGGHSALTGSDAVGGAIQLITRETTAAKGFLYGMNTSLGSFGMQAQTLYGSHQYDKFYYFSSYHRLRSDGNFSYALPQSGVTEARKNNDYRGDNFFFKAGLDFNRENQLQLLIHTARVNKGNAGSVNLNPWTQESMLTPRARSEMSRQIFLLRSENQISSRLRLEARSSYQTYTYAYKNPDGWTPTDDRHENSALGLSLQSQMAVNSRLQLLAGAEFRQDRLTSTRFRAEDRNSESLYGQAELRLPLFFFGPKAFLHAIPALRWDHYSDTRAQAAPKLGLMLSAGEQFNAALRGNIGKSFRVPTFDDLYWPDEVWAKGNPALIPETSKDFDLGVVFSHRAGTFWQAEATYFNNTIRNLIAWGPDAVGVWMPMNLGQVKIKGIETGLRLRLPENRAFFNGSYTWLQAEDATPDASTRGKRLLYRPENKWDLMIGTYVGPVLVSMDYRSVGARFITQDNLKKLPAYQLVNGKIAANFRLAALAFETQIQVGNILNKSIYINDGYPFPGREFRFSVGMQY